MLPGYAINPPIDAMLIIFPRLSFCHVFTGCLATQERSFEVHINDGVPVFLRVFESGPTNRSPGAVNQYVERAPSSDSSLDDVFDVALLVTSSSSACASPSSFPDQTDGLLRVSQRNISRNDPRANIRKSRSRWHAQVRFHRQSREPSCPLVEIGLNALFPVNLAGSQVPLYPVPGSNRSALPQNKGAQGK